MLTPAHLASSYLLSQIPVLIGTNPLEPPEIIAVVIAGSVLDLDFVIGTLLGKKGDEHHRFFTHTPAFAFILWILCFMSLTHYFRPITWIIILISLLLHLVLDDVGYWFCKLGWQEVSKYPQINWLYPSKRFAPWLHNGSNIDLFQTYMVKAKVSVGFEILLVLAAIVTWLI